MPDNNWTLISGSTPQDYTDTAVFEVNPDTKQIALIAGQALVAGEKDSQYISFLMPRYWDGIDISDKSFTVEYALAGTYYGTSEAVNAEMTTEQVRFGWIVPETACAISGTLLFVLKITSEDYILKTQIVEHPVFKTINVEDVVPEPTKEAWYIEFQNRVDGAISEAEAAVDTAQATLTQVEASVGLAQTAAQEAQTAEGNAEAAAAIAQIRYGSPLVAQIADEMVEQNRVYVYTGSETGYTAGHWYYYDGTAWVSGGVYNGTGINTDTTLTQAGMAADAKATGDEISQIKEDLNAIEQTQGYDELDINSATTFSKRIKDGVVYINGVKDSSGEYQVDGWAYIVVTAGARYAILSFLTQSISELSSGDTPSFCVGETAEHKIDANTTEIFKVPSDCTVLNVSRKITNVMQVPSKIMIIKTGSLTEKCYNFVDPTLTKSGEMADAKVTGDKINALADAVYKDVLASDVLPTWKQGNFNGTTGVVATGTTSIISNDYIPSNVNGISINTDGYLFSVFAYDSDDSYIGLYDATSDSYKKSGWSNYWITDFDITKQNPNGYKLKLRIKNSDGTTITADKADKLTYKVIRVEYTGSTNPCEYDWKYEACTFAKMLCIGDSLIEGGANAPNITPDDANATRTVARGTYSIPNFLTKFFGIETTNWGISGSTSRSWYNSKSSENWGGYDSALIYIGSNDYNYVTTDGMTIEEGANLSETMIRNIITKLKTDNAGIRIFLCTLSPGTTTGAFAQYRLPLMEKIRTIASDTSGVYLIDLNEYSLRKSGLPYGNGHPTAIGYQWMAREIGAYMCWWISHYPSEFEWIRWIGTRYAVTGTAPDSGGSDDGGYDGDVQ